MFASMKGKARSFSSGKWAGSARTFLPLLAGLLLCGFALAAAGRRVATVEKEIRRQANPVEVVVASAPIPTGETFGTQNLAKKSIPSSGTGQRNVPASEFELLLGARAKTAIDPGEPVLWTDVEEPYNTDAFSRTVLPGHRAMTLGVDSTSSFAGLLHPGDRVDLLTFTSSSTVHTFAGLVGKDAFLKLAAHAAVASIGPITTATLAEYGLTPRIEPAAFTIPALAAAIVEYFRRNVSSEQ